MTVPPRANGAPRLGVGIVGAGRVGAVLGSALRAAGHPVVGVSAVSQQSRDRAEALLPGVPVLDTDEVVRRAELVLLTVPDDALRPLVSGLAELGAWQVGQLVVHTAGRFGVDVLGPATAAGAIGLAVHPAMTFTGTSLDLSRLEATTFAVTAAGPFAPIGQALVVELGGEPVVVAEEDRGLYHAALAHGANHLVVLVAQAAEALAAAGVADAGTALRPLLDAALDAALRQASPPGGTGPAATVGTRDDLERRPRAGAIAALTGPVRRGDVGTVTEHLAELTAWAAHSGAVDVVAAYRVLARSATVRALTAGLVSETQAQHLLALLADQPPDAPGRNRDLGGKP